MSGLFDDVLRSTLDEIDAVVSRNGSAPSIPTGFADLDEILNGLPLGSLTVIGAHPGVGSSTLALDIVRCASVRHGIPAAYLSLDDTAEAVTQRLISAECRVRLSEHAGGPDDR
ncbi:DnaB-like helicase C-terminal domain-containing protein [Actinoalloteichus caeruleus]|uniref:DnaB-like helicase C-terminal domain-containing protein n=1 Tax=Actinoalloteichus cyanogriseus TaxID=2893586 RepID=UPI003AAE13BA